MIIANLSEKRISYINYYLQTEDLQVKGKNIMTYKELLKKYIGSQCTINLDKNQITFGGAEIYLGKYTHTIVDVTDDYVTLGLIQDNNYFVVPLANISLVFRGMEPYREEITKTEDL